MMFSTATDVTSIGVIAGMFTAMVIADAFIIICN